MSESIKTIAEPRVYLVGTQTIDDAALDRFLADEGVAGWRTDTEVAGEKLVEVAGRLCYMSFAKPRPGGNAAYLGHILEVGHGSVLEHTVFNLIFAGVSRSLTHELARNYIAKVTGRKDARALDVSIDMTNMNRPTGAEKAGLNWLRMTEMSRDCYASLADYLENRSNRTVGRFSIDRKPAREAARSVLPNATETKIFVTGNARALRHFIEMRADPAADAEIRRLALAVLATLREAAPNLFGDYQVSGDPPAATTPHRKV
jgi:thymidylate synthase (FAD)